jgi:hypothetical protein
VNSPEDIELFLRGNDAINRLDVETRRTTALRKALGQVAQNRCVFRNRSLPPPGRIDPSMLPF